MAQESDDQGLRLHRMSVFTAAGFGGASLNVADRILSNSYVTHGVEDIPAFLKALEALLDATSPHGPVEMRYATRAIAWRVQG